LQMPKLFSPTKKSRKLYEEEDKLKILCSLVVIFALFSSQVVAQESSEASGADPQANEEINQDEVNAIDGNAKLPNEESTNDEPVEPSESLDDQEVKKTA